MKLSVDNIGELSHIFGSLFEFLKPEKMKVFVQALVEQCKQRQTLNTTQSALESKNQTVELIDCIWLLDTSLLMSNSESAMQQQAVTKHLKSKSGDVIPDVKYVFE